MEELSNFNMSLYKESIQFWRTEEKCRIKTKSIKDIEKSTIQVNIENKELEKQLIDKKSKIIETRDNIVSIDKFVVSLYETLAHLEVQNKIKEFSINKSRSDYELQIFIRQELYQKEKEQINNMPEISDLITADSELESTKLEYEQLLIQEKNLVKEITKAKNDNYMSLNDIIIKFATVYVEMVSLDKIYEYRTALLSKLKTEYSEKMKMKNSLLQSSKEKINNVSFWTNNICPLKLNIDNLDLLNRKPKSNFTHNISFRQKLENKKHLKFEKKLKKNVTFILSPEDKILDNNDNLNDCNSSKINLEESNITNNEIYTNLTLVEPTHNANVTTDTLINNISRLNNVNSDNNEKKIDECDSYIQTNKRKIIESQTHFEFKKPYNQVRDIITIDKNSIHSKIVQSTTENKNINFENDINQEEVKSLNTSMNNKDNDFNFDISIQEINISESNKNSTKNSSDNTNMFGQTSKFNEIPSQVQNTFLSGLFWNDNGEQESQTSLNTSFYGSDVSELFETSQNIQHSEFPDKQLHFLNTFNSNLELTNSSNVQKSENIKPNQSGNMYQCIINNELSKELETNSNTLTNKTKSRMSKNVMLQPIRPNFQPSEQFRLMFNNN